MKDQWWPEQRCEVLPEVPIVWDSADMLERLMGDEDLARTILDGFLADIPRQIQALKACLDGDDAPGTARQAHTIKGASATVGGEALREAAFEMEKAARSGDLDAVRALMQLLEARFEEFRTVVEKA